MTPTDRVERCRTCSAPLPSTGPVFDADEGVYVTPEPFCSIHCEHYAGLQRAASHGDAPAGY